MTYGAIALAHAPTSNTSPCYDVNGNRTSVALPSDLSSATGAANRMLYDGTYYYQYDASGNRIARWVNNNGVPEGSPQPGDTGITIYKWNNQNELTAVTTFGNWAGFNSGMGGSETDYAYDPFGEMVSRTNGGATENYVYDGRNLVLVLNASGQVTEREVYAAAVDQILATETVTPLSAGSTQAAGTVNWLLTDNQGTVRDVAQFNGVTTGAVDHLVYDSFGQIAWQTPNATQPRFTYADMRFDVASGLYYDAARWYDAVNGLFISQDPIGFAGGQANLCEFVGNSPNNFTDPSGLAAVTPRPAPPSPLTAASEKQWIIDLANWLKANGVVRQTVIGGSDQEASCECEEQANDLYNHLPQTFTFWTDCIYNRTRTNFGKHGWGLNVFPPVVAREKWNVVRFDPKTGVGSGGAYRKHLTFDKNAFILSPFWGYQNEISGIDVYSLAEFMKLFSDDGDYDEPSIPIPSGQHQMF